MPKLGFVARITTALMRHLLTRCHEIFSVLMSHLILSVGLIRWGPSLLPLWMKELRLSGGSNFLQVTGTDWHIRKQILFWNPCSRPCHRIANNNSPRGRDGNHRLESCGGQH